MGNRPSLVTLAPKMLHRNDVLWAGLLGSSAGLGLRRQPLTAILSLSLSPQDTATTKKAALSFVPWRLPEEVNTMTGTWHCLRKSWTSAQRYHLFWANSSATPISHKAPRSMRRLKVGRAPAGEQPRHLAWAPSWGCTYPACRIFLELSSSCG